jgi:ABC-type transporter Mla subunit MlaD
MSLIALVLGLILVESLLADLSASFRVSESAVVAIGETVDVVEGSVARIDESLDAASASLRSVATAADIANEGLVDVAGFLEEDLPNDIEAILVAMPAAIQTASAIDSTLSALSFFGVGYSPEEPFDDSLRRVERALSDMPDDLRAQSETIRALVPAVGSLGRQTERLAEAIDEIEADLDEIGDLVVSYRVTIAEAQTSIEETSSSLGDQAWLLRLLIVLLALGGVAVGSALISLARGLERIPEVVFDDEPAPALPRRSSTS